MDSNTRNAIQRATQAARTLLEKEYRERLEGALDIRTDGTIPEAAGEHLDASERVVRSKIAP